MADLLSRWCSCGASVKASSHPPEGAAFVVAAFELAHVELGHRMVSAREAANARRRERRREQGC